ncbi:MAG: DUF3616 domain-containing protein [Kofleriaceae bacterium]|nr:DUF3616 domain-containing protein [Kofleriaceae bacterium]MCL4223280.1 DUF3616 domain-containing protein [Myxococcales bacterium]
MRPAARPRFDAGASARATCVAATALTTLACAAPAPAPPTEPVAVTAPGPAAPAAPTAPAPAGFRRGRVAVFTGACDASGAVPLSERQMVVADDEDNVLRVYDADAGGAPVAQLDLSPALGLPLVGKRNPRPPELDLEAATLLGDRAYWLTSHGRSKKARRKDERLLVVATSTLAADGGGLRVIGQGYDRLLADLIAAPALAPFGLAAAAERAPKDEGGLNLEALTATPDGHALLGFRNPVPGGRALLVPITNLPALTDPAAGGPARFGAAVQLELGGRGVRSLSWWRGRYLVVAGHHAERGRSALYTWDGVGAAVGVDLDLSDLNPEGFFTPEGRDEIMLLSDDGDQLVDGQPCKRLTDPTRKRFRGVWLTPG